jgi:TolB-like protein/DNA-binding winged helix-turn-helix (wHTH) protein/Tfp pilus assembly protein PilF
MDANLNRKPPVRFQILDLEVDAGRQTVTRNGAELHVPKLSFDLLIALACAAPNVVTVSELMERVWPRQVVGVETVAQRIKLLRRALEDDAEQPRYIAGERRRGYRVLAPVLTPAPRETTEFAFAPAAASASSASEPVLTAPHELPAPARSRHRTRGVLIAATAVVLFAALIDLIARGPHPDAQGDIVSRTAPAEPHTVAVLPFRGISGGGEDELLGAGISELVINRLASEPRLVVIAADSALAPRREAESAAQVGQRLGAHFVVDGTVQREGAQLRVTAELIDVSSGRHVGALLVERPATELFHLQDDIAGRVSYLLLGKVYPEDAPVEEFGAEAALAYLRGRALLAGRKTSDAEPAIAEFTRAISAAPTFASAYAGRAEARFQRLFLVLAYNNNAGQLFEEMQPDIDRALQLDPGNGPALFIRGKLRQLRDDDDGAERDFQRGIAISPGFAPGVAYYADFVNSVRHRPEEALAILDAAIRLNPLAPRLIYLKAMILSQAHRDDVAAADLYMRTIQVAPDFYVAYNRLASMRWSEGRVAEAIGFAEASVRIDPDAPWSRELLARLYVDLGDLSAAREVLVDSRRGNAHEGAGLLCYREGHLDAAVSWLHVALTDLNTDTGGAPLAATITALLEQAMRTGDYAAARTELMKMSWLTDEHGAFEYNYANALPLLQFATLEQLAGHRVAAEQIATRVLGMDDDPTAQGNIAGRMQRIRMLALAVLGRDREALAILDAQRETLARELWWVWIERHPAMERLRHDPRVQQLLAEIRSWSLRERALVEAERQSGKLPVRAAQAAPDPCAPPTVARLNSPTS